MEIKNIFLAKESEEFTSIKFSGNIIGIDAFNLKAELKKYATRNKNLRLDLSEVNEISLTGLNSILISKLYADRHQNEVTLVVKEDSKILKHLHLTKMTSQFIIEIAGI